MIGITSALTPIHTMNGCMAQRTGMSTTPAVQPTTMPRRRERRTAAASPRPLAWATSGVTALCRPSRKRKTGKKIDEPTATAARSTLA